MIHIFKGNIENMQLLSERKIGDFTVFILFLSSQFKLDNWFVLKIKKKEW